MKESKKRLYVEPDGFWTEASMLFMALAMVFLLIGSIGRWEDLHYLITMVALPIASGLLFLLCLLLFGKRAFWTTVIPVVIGVAYFVFRAIGLPAEWQVVAQIVLCVAVVVIYAMAFSHWKLKWLLALILLGVFAYRVGVVDLPVLMNLQNPVSFVEGMQEMSLLTILLSLLSVSLAMKFPKSKDAEEEQSLSPEEIPAPEPEPVPEPAPEEVPEPEKKLSRRERRRLEREQKAAKKDAPVPAAPAAPEETPAEITVPAPVPEELPEEPMPQTFWEEAERPVPEASPEELPEEPIPQPFREEEEIPAPETPPIQEVELPAEPAEVYPLAEPYEPEEEAAPVPEDGPETP